MHKNLKFNKYLIIFSILFTTGMYLSKTIQPIYFDENNALEVFGFSYGAMAIAGMMSFLWGSLVDRLGWYKALIIGSLVYSIALLGRVFLNPYIAITIGFMAGSGASIALLSVRSWIVQYNQNIELEKISSVRNLGNQIGIFAAIIFSTLFLSIPYFNDNTESIILLLLSAVPILLSLVVVKIFNQYTKTEKYSNQHSNVKEKLNKKNNHINKDIRNIVVTFLFISFVTGLYISFISPYTSIILIKYGFGKNYAVFFLLITVSIQIATSLFYLKKYSGNILLTYIFCEASLLIITFFILIALNNNITTLLIIGFIFRVIFLTVSAIVEESIHYKYLSSQKNTGYIFGILQTAFLLGDSIGGFLAPIIIKNLSIKYLFFCSIFIIGINIFLLLILILKIKLYTESSQSL